MWAKLYDKLCGICSRNQELVPVEEVIRKLEELEKLKKAGVEVLE